MSNKCNTKRQPQTSEAQPQTPNTKRQTLYFHENRHPHTHHAFLNAQLGEEIRLW